MNIKDLAPALELTAAEARSFSGGKSYPVEPDGGIGGPGDQPDPITKEWFYPLPALPSSPVFDAFDGGLGRIEVPPFLADYIALDDLP